MSQSAVMDLSNINELKVNSMPVIVRSSDTFDEIVAIIISARGGAGITDKAGVLEMLESLLTSGTYSYTKDQIDKLFTRYGAHLSISSGADYLEVSLKCLKKYLPELLPVISELVRVPLFEKEEIELTRQQMLNALKSEQDSADGLLHLLAHKSFYKNHPYSNRPAGFLDTVPTITREDLTKMLPTVFNKQNLLFTMIGKISADEAKGIVEKYFAALPEGAAADRVTKKIENPVGEIAFKEFHAPTTYFIASFKAPALDSEEYPALAIATQILDNRLFEEVRTKRGLTYSVSAHIGMKFVNSGGIYVTSTKLPEAVKVISEEIKRIKTKLVDAKFLELQVRKFKSSWFMGRETGSSQAKILAHYELIGLGWQSSTSFIDRLNKVTPKDIQEAAQKYIKDFSYAMVGPKKVDLSGALPK